MKKKSSFALYVYFAIVLASIILVKELLIYINTPWWLVASLMMLLGLGSLVPIASRADSIQRIIGNLKSGLPLPVIKQRWPDPLYPLLQQIKELAHLVQDISEFPGR